MIIKLEDCCSRLYTDSDVISKCENLWLKVVPPFFVGGVHVDIGGKSYRISSRHIADIVNEERHLYQYCTYCGSSQKAGLERCDSCYRRDKLSYIMPPPESDVSCCGKVMINVFSV